MTASSSLIFFVSYFIITQMDIKACSLTRLLHLEISAVGNHFDKIDIIHE